MEKINMSGKTYALDVKHHDLPQNETDAVRMGYQGTWANTWGENPPEFVRECTHPLRTIMLGRTLDISFCDVCKFYILCDSSG